MVVRPLWWRTWTTVTVLVSMQHLVWAALLFYSTLARGATPLAFANQLPALPEAWLLAYAAVAALWSVRHDRRGPTRLGMAVALPQQLLVIASALSSAMAIVNGHYADLEPRPREFIAADQQLVVLVGVVHTIVLILFHGRRGAYRS